MAKNNLWKYRNYKCYGQQNPNSKNDVILARTRTQNRISKVITVGKPGNNERSVHGRYEAVIVCMLMSVDF